MLYAYTDPDWGDLLTAYDGTAITYDTIGNPLYDGTWTYTWEHGRRLASMTDGTTTWSYSYNADGLRTGRTDGTNTYQYVYTDGQLSAMYYEGTRYLFHYEGTTPVAMYVGGTPYYYAANICGDVVAIFDKDGNRVVEYTYDAWGNILSVSGSMADTIGAINPLRYRGYVYDAETGLYYLQNRYYNPEICRFINADNYPTTGQCLTSNNMFAYCGSSDVYAYAGAISNASAHIGGGVATQQFSIYVCYDVPLYDQNGYKLCWAFCQVMIEDFWAGIIRSNDQATDRAIEISISINGSNWNVGGWPTNASNTFAELGKEPPSIYDLYHALFKNGPFYAYYGGNGFGAHLIVVKGVDLTRGVIYTNNPWGITGEQTYEEFLNGFLGDTSINRPFGFVIYPD